MKRTVKSLLSARIALPAILLASAGACWGGISGCSGHTPAESNTSGPGCTQVDLLFGGIEQFAASTMMTGSPNTSDGFGTTTTILLSDGTNTTMTGAGAVSLEFEGDTAYGSNGTNGGAATLTLNFNFDVASSAGLVIDGFYFDVDFTQVDGGASGTVTETVCLTAPGCGIPFTTSFTATSAGDQNMNQSFLGPTSGDVFVNVQATITLPTNSSQFFFPDFVTGFDQEEGTPEPSTFVLMGTALAAVAFLAYRRRRTALGAR